ncbi:MAG: hypothetical protein V8R43_07730 [Dorea sp.]
MKEKLLRELTGKRKRCVKYFQMNEKGVAAAVYPGRYTMKKTGNGKISITVWKQLQKKEERYIRTKHPT